ncbi:hypothetical protein IFT69_26565 [Pseudomonas putida]|nr:hypothetical protein [Pseudomonas putida]
MKFLISFVIFDTTVDDTLLGGGSTMSGLRHAIANSVTEHFSPCESIREVEATFEAIHNYSASNDHVAHPRRKVKVLKVEALPY